MLVRDCLKCLEVLRSKYSTHKALDQCAPRVYGVKEGRES
jgi:hypothetical protein